MCEMDEITLNRTNIKRYVLKELETIMFPMCSSRKNISSKNTLGFVLGDVNYRNEKKRGPSRWNSKFPELFKLLKYFISLYHPSFEYTTIQVNKTTECKPHIDKNNVGVSYIIGLGSYTGGELNIEGNSFNIKNRWKKFDGTKAHWVEPFKGDRYSIVYFTHTFKPPSSSLRGLSISKKGIRKQGKYIKLFK